MVKYGFDGDAQMKPDDYETKNDRVTYTREKKSPAKGAKTAKHEHDDHGYSGKDLEDIKLNLNWKSNTIEVEGFKNYAKYEGYFPYTTEFMSVIPGTVLPSYGKMHSNNIRNLINAPL